jgi:hypothetical protein
MSRSRAKAREQAGLANDLLYGAAAIAEFMFGDEDERRKVYALAESKQIPVFRLGTILCARKSSLIADVAARERAATATLEPAE